MKKKMDFVLKEIGFLGGGGNILPPQGISDKKNVRVRRQVYQKMRRTGKNDLRCDGENNKSKILFYCLPC